MMQITKDNSVTKLLRRLILITLTTLSVINSYGQSPKKVHSFPEDYINKTITFKDIRLYPTLEDKKGYYIVQLDVSPSLNHQHEWGFGLMDKVVGAVKKNIASKMIDKNISGYNNFYHGSVTGKIVKTDAVWGSKYVFVISKVIIQSQYDMATIVYTFE